MAEPDLKTLATEHRFKREAGVALLLASVILGGFLLVPHAPAPTVPEVYAASSTPSAFSVVPLEARAAIVYDLATHETLFAKNADAQLPLASLTKLLTVYSALAELAPDTPVTVSKEETLLDTPRAFRAGDTLSLSDLARLTLTASLNDGAAAIAEATALREGVSTERMLGSAAAALGLAETYAVNGNGLDVSTVLPGSYGSAHDVVLLAGALVAQAPAIAAATTQASAEANTEGGRHITVRNTDPFVGAIPGLELSKTGYTDLAGGNLALVFDAGIGHPIAVVVLGSSADARFSDGKALVAATLAHFADVPSL